MAETGPSDNERVEPPNLGADEPLHVRLSHDLKRRLRASEWSIGDRLPTEAQLSQQYHVSRATVRTSIKLLEAQGLVQTRHGSGTFVTPFGVAIRTGLQELRSITDTIREQGHEPSIDYRLVEFRQLDEKQAESLGRHPGSPSLHLERAFYSDGQLVAFCYDTLPADLLPAQFDPRAISGSLFAFLEERAHIRSAYATAAIHSVHSHELGWGDARPENGLYILLEQLHFDPAGHPMLDSLNYFVEDRFRFTILRTR